MSRRHQRRSRSTTPQSQAASQRPVPARGEWLLPGALVLLALLLGLVQMADTDVWWHLRTGQLIWQRGAVPTTDWYTYTNPDSPWIDLHWCFQLAVAGLWELGGVKALVIAKSIVGALTFVACLAARRSNWRGWHSAVCWLPSVLLFAGRYDVRPEIVSLLLFAVTLTILFHLRAVPKLAWLLPVLQLIWVNVHSLFVLGLGLWAFFLIEALLCPWMPWETPAAERGNVLWGRWLIVTGLQGLACLINPYGLQGARFPLVLWSRLQGGEHRFYQQFAGEFLGVGDFISEHGIGGLFCNLSTAMLMTITVATTVSFALLACRRRFSLFRALVFTAFAYLAWQANRNGVFFALAAGAVLRWNVGDWQELRPQASPGSFNLGKVTIAIVLGLALVMTPLGMLSLLRPLPGPRFNPAFEEWGLPPFATGPRWPGVDETPFWYAHDAVRFLGRPEMPDHIFASHLGHASLCIFRFAPDKRVFADPRLEVNTRDTLARYLEIYQRLAAHDPRAETLLRESGGGELPALLVGTADLWPNRHQWFSHPRWRPVYADPVAVVFLEERQAKSLGLARVRWEVILGKDPGSQPQVP